MPLASDLAPPSFRDPCPRCGRALGTLYWVENLTHGVHTTCRNWSRVPFIFESRLRQLRGRWRRATADERVRIAEVGKRSGTGRSRERSARL